MTPSASGFRGAARALSAAGLSAVALFTAGLAFAIAPARGEDVRTLDNGLVHIAYDEPKSEAHQPIYERLKKRRVLEQLKQFLAPLRLTKTLLIKTAGCDGRINAYFNSAKGMILICYEYVADIHKYAAMETTLEGAKPEDTIIGPFVGVLFHELGHAVFDYLRAPLWGREEDAADQVATFILLQFGPDVARRTVLGLAHRRYSRAKRRKLSKDMFADEHGLDWQRYFNALCLAYGADPDTFRPLVQTSVLPEARAQGCAREYKQVERAFVEYILPHIDGDLMKQVQAREWLPAESVQ